jgi:hypothetical protein
MRDVQARLMYYRLFGAPRAGLCAAAVRAALAAPWQGYPDAIAAARAVPAGQMHRNDAPEGSIVYFSGGSDGHGHCCFALGNHIELSVDVLRGQPGVVGMVPFSWFGRNWPSLTYVGWSWFWGAVDTRPEVLTVGSGGS